MISVWDRAPKLADVPVAYRHMLGSITAEKSIPQLKLFMEKGGSIVTVGKSTNLAYHLGLPVKNAMLEVKADGKEKLLPAEKFYIPGSLLKVNLDTKQPANWGMPKEVTVVFNNSPVFHLSDRTKAQNSIQPLAWFDQDEALKSGWAWGQNYLKGGIAAFVAPVGKGKLYAFGPEITFRSQAHSTFKMLFNELYLSH